MFTKESAPQLLIHLQCWATILKVRDISDVVFNDERFVKWSGSSKPEQHHYGTGGLIKHTLEVVHLCLHNNAMLGSKRYVNIGDDVFKPENKPVDPARLFLAALFHDVGKMWDYDYGTHTTVDQWVLKLGDKVPEPSREVVWHGTDHKRKIHHITRSALVWNQTAEKFNIPNPDEIMHAILAHHGRREYGSPVAPNTKMAWLLHLCDGISARMDDCERFDRI